jgi:hypothetical protein
VTIAAWRSTPFDRKAGKTHAEARRIATIAFDMDRAARNDLAFAIAIALLGALGLACIALIILTDAWREMLHWLQVNLPFTDPRPNR